jgi:hypothetical protein
MGFLVFQTNIFYSTFSQLSAKFYGRYKDLICPYNLFVGPHAVCCVSYQLLSHSRHTDLDCGSYRLSNLEIQLTAGVTGQQGMLIPPWHLIPPLIYSEARVTPILWFVFPIELTRLITVRYFCHFIHVHVCVYNRQTAWILKYLSYSEYSPAKTLTCKTECDHNTVMHPQ